MKKFFLLKNVSITKIALLPVAMAALVALAAGPSVAAVTTNVTVPDNGSFINPCNGDLMTFTGFLHTVASTTFDASGFSTHLSVNEEQVKDTDTVTGIVCSDTTGVAGNTHNIVLGGPPILLPFELTVTFTATTNCPGQVGSFLFKELIHLTVNPDGTVTVLFSNAPGTLECK